MLYRHIIAFHTNSWTFFTGDHGKWFGFGPFGEIIDNDHIYLKAGCAVGSGLMRSIPQTANGHGEVTEVSFSGWDLGVLENL